MDTDRKSKTVATIDVNLTLPQLSEHNWIEESVHEHMHCILCGSTLQFKQKTDFAALTVSEDASCPSCNIRNRQTQHTLQ
jgi:plasmid rolling circle replication initiator protein Rep